MDIIYCNDKCTDFFLASLESVVMNNPTSTVHVITKGGDDLIRDKGNNVKVWQMTDFESACALFDKNYIHKSTNQEYFERACLRRWFLINALVQKQGLKRFVVMDWDMLCFCDFDKEMERFKDYDFTYMNKIMFGLSLWNNTDALKFFVDLIDSVYQAPDVGVARVLLSHFDKLQREGKLGGVCDMTFTGYMIDLKKYKTFDMYQLLDDGSCFDANICLNDLGFEYEKERKIVTLENGKAYCEKDTWPIRMNTLHFYNGTKPEMIRCWQEAKKQMESIPVEENMVKSYLDLLNIQNGFFVDVGASSPNSSSNTLELAKRGWRGLAIECDEIKLNELRSYYKLFPAVTVSGERVTPMNIVELMKGVPKEFDFLSFDIDGYDYYVLKEILSNFRPSLACVEINEKIPPPIKFAVQYTDDYKWEGDHFYGMSIAMLGQLCEEKGYKIIELIYNNAFIQAEPVEQIVHSCESAYSIGYLQKPDRKKRFHYNSDMEYLIGMDAAKAVEEIKNKFKDKKTPFICEM
jgi:hypothetical protein